MCRLLEVSTSGFYAWLRRGPSDRARRDAELRRSIRRIHSESLGTYGSPRIHAELSDEGTAIGRKRVARLMQAEGLKGVSRRRGTRTTIRGKEARQAPDLVERDFTADGPNRLWVADITYLPTWSGFLYLAVVLDAWSRRLVGWSMASHLRTELVLEALEMALAQRRPDNVIHHSDQGSQARLKASSQHWLVSRLRLKPLLFSILPAVGAVRNCGKPVPGFSKGLWESQSDFHRPGSFHSPSGFGLRRGLLPSYCAD